MLPEYPEYCPEFHRRLERIIRIIQDFVPRKQIIHLLDMMYQIGPESKVHDEAQEVVSMLRWYFEEMWRVESKKDRIKLGTILYYKACWTEDMALSVHYRHYMGLKMGDLELDGAFVLEKVKLVFPRDPIARHLDLYVPN